MEKMEENNTNNQLIGRVIATEKSPTTIDAFTFWTRSDVILNPFDVIKVDHLDNSHTYGVIEEISHMTDAASFLTEYISSDFGKLDVDSPTMRIGMNCVKAKVIMNDREIYNPVRNNEKVYLATREDIEKALGLNNKGNTLVCGYLKMYEGNKETAPITMPVKLNPKFIIGPEGAHLNISGVSGLAAKTSYSMFLMKSIQDYYRNLELERDEEDRADGTHEKEEGVAFVLFNVKGKDLLAIDQPNDFEDDGVSRDRVLDEYKELGLTSEPFKNVHYYYPNSGTKYENTYLSKEEVQHNLEIGKASKFLYTYEDDRQDIDLLFTDIDDPTQTMSNILDQVTNESGEFADINSWGGFIDKLQKNTLPGAGKNRNERDTTIMVSSWKKFTRIAKAAINKKPIFATRPTALEHTVRLGDALKKIQRNEVHVIDIAKLADDQQAFVFGSTLRTLHALRLGEYDDEKGEKPPARIVIFIDELNKYASKDSPKTSPILKEILDVAERGRSLGIVLFAAEQFRSAIHDRVKGNCSTQAYGRTNVIEVAKPDYRSIPEVYKNMMTRLQQGEYIIQNPTLRSLLKIKFPHPIYKQYK